jgi:predicted permease
MNGMFQIIMTDLVPIFVIMALGYASGKSQAFDGTNARSFNKLVLNYALPAALFLSIAKSDRSMLFSDLKLTIVSAVVIVAVFMFSYYGCYKFFKHTKSEAAVCALIAGSPTIGFLGFAVLDPIFGNNSETNLVVGIVAIIVNAITIPIGLCLLNPSQQKAQKADVTDGTAEEEDRELTLKQKEELELKKLEQNAFINAIIQPVVWSPILAVVLVLLGFRLPNILDPTFELIAKANSGVAVFAAGLTLSAVSFVFNKEVWYNTFVKLILMPGALLIVGKLVGMTGLPLQMLVIAGALPPAFSGIIIGSRYNVYVKIGTSSLAVSTFFFIVSAPLWIWICRMVAP